MDGELSRRYAMIGQTTLTGRIQVGACYLLLGASRRGKSHAHAGTPTARTRSRWPGANKARSHGGAWRFADGAGSCRLSRVGARIATQTAIAHVTGALTDDSDLRATIDGAARAALQEMKKEASQRPCDLSDLSCTLLIMLWTRRPTENGSRRSKQEMALSLPSMRLAISRHSRRRTQTRPPVIRTLSRASMWPRRGIIGRTSAGFHRALSASLLLRME